MTALFVQDGGVSGSVYNLVSLLLVGALAERMWGSGRMMGIFLIGGLAGEIVALAWQPIGAGDSVGNFSLAGSIAMACRRAHGDIVTHGLALLALIADTALLLTKDIHGAAALAGVILALRVVSRSGGGLRQTPSHS